MPTVEPSAPKMVTSCDRMPSAAAATCAAARAAVVGTAIPCRRSGTFVFCLGERSGVIETMGSCAASRVMVTPAVSASSSLPSLLTPTAKAYAPAARLPPGTVHEQAVSEGAEMLAHGARVMPSSIVVLVSRHVHANLR